MAPTRWFHLVDESGVASPSLLIYRERVDENLRRMVAIAGSPQRLRPHVKTHKVPQLIRAQLALGIERFKCATIAEAEMTAAAGAPDVLLAYQPVGPNVTRVLELVRRYPAVRFSALVDCASAAEALGSVLDASGLSIDVLLDLDTGMHRSGIEPGDEAVRLYEKLARLPGVRPDGLHAYDGHLRDQDPATRKARCDAAFEPVSRLADRLTRSGLPVSRIVVGGSPTFPFHAARPEVECSPGTCVYWDAGYGTLPDLEFLPAALVLTRVISKPGGNRVCLDLGHKAIASETPHPRVVLFAPEGDAPLDCTFVGHSEEHLVIETTEARALSVGDCLYGIPWHICPTVALHAEANVVEGGRVVERWPIEARARKLSI
ncbi:MAG TPA: D-TA family PLP-dependent enzyme [Vicinamibacterales bacterium]|nr:D-TA family PLP-dependent enzyme [Vicinamibacterales bacterium]